MQSYFTINPNYIYNPSFNNKPSHNKNPRYNNNPIVMKKKNNHNTNPNSNLDYNNKERIRNFTVLTVVNQRIVLEKQ